MSEIATDRTTRSPPDTSPRLLSIQYLRAVAALMVVTFHLLVPAALVGAAGVDIFFVVSGFVMWLVIDSEDIAPLRFAYDRAARILPLYWFTTLLLLGLALLLPHLFQRFHPSAEWTLLSLALLPVYQPGTGNIYPILNQGWTLNYEMFFYAILFVATFAPRAGRWSVASAILIALLCVGQFHVPVSATAKIYTNPLLAEFLLGFWFGRFFTSRGWRMPRAALLLVAAGIAGFAVAAFAGADPNGWRRIVIWGCPAFLLVAGCVGLEATGHCRNFRVARLLGDASYSIYLTHGLFISALTHFWALSGFSRSGGLNPAAFAAIGLVTCAGGGMLVHLFVERPMLKALRRYRPANEAISAARPTVAFESAAVVDEG